MLFENWPEFCMVEIRWAIVITDLPFMTRSNASWTWNSLALSRALKQKKKISQSAFWKDIMLVKKAII